MVIVEIRLKELSVCVSAGSDQFVLKKGESLKQHVGILVHSGNAKTGRVAERYQQFIAGKFD